MLPHQPPRRCSEVRRLSHGPLLHRPTIFAWVIAIVIMLAGALSILELPISPVPSIAPPAVASTPLPRRLGQGGRTRSRVIEQKLTGLDGLLYA